MEMLILMALLFAGGGYAIYHYEASSVADACSELIKAHNLSNCQLKAMTFTATTQGMDLAIDWYMGKNSSTSFSLSLPGLPRSLRLNREGMWSGLKRGLGNDDWHTGDSTFDAAVEVRGGELEVFSLLGHPVRNALRLYIEHFDGHVADGCLKMSRSGMCTDHAELNEIVGRLLELGRVLHKASRDHQSSRLMQHALNDDCQAYRERCLELAVRHYPETRSVCDACRKLLASKQPHVQLLAASALGAEGEPTLLRLLSDRKVPDQVRAAAFRRLPTTNWADWSSAGVHLQVAVLDRESAARRVPLDILEYWFDGDAAAAVCQAGVWRSDLFPTVLKGLQHCEEGVRQASVFTLHSAGTIEHIQALQAAARGALKAPARAAIQAIQERAGSPDAGRLSLADDTTGSLSVPDSQ